MRRSNSASVGNNGAEREKREMSHQWEVVNKIHGLSFNALQFHSMHGIDQKNKDS